jgi:uncharacterized protein YcbX
MWLASIWRYPVKSMAGEELSTAELTPDGIAGDRLLFVKDMEERVLTARTFPKLLGHRGTLGPDGEPLVDGRPCNTAAVAQDVIAAAGPGTRLTRAEGRRRFDILPLLVATDGAIAAFGHDGRRLRPNLIIGGVPGLTERTWEGGTLVVGSALIELADLRRRCVMTTFDPDSQIQDLEVLAGIEREFDGQLALNARVVRGGRIQVGDPVVFQSP